MNSPILSSEEIKNLVYDSNPQKNQNSPALDLEKFEEVENPKFPFFSRSIPKLLIVAVISAPAFLIVWFLTNGFGGSPETTAQVASGSSNSQIEKNNESLKEQVDELQVQNAVLVQDFEELQTQKDKVKIIKTKPKPAPAPAKTKKAEIKREPTTPKPVESVKPTPQPVIEPVDPYEEWNRYAQLGVTIGNGFTEESKNRYAQTDNGIRGENSESSSLNRQQNPSLLAKSDTKNFTTSNSISQVSLGNSDENLEESNQSSKKTQNILLSDTSNTSFLEAKRQEYKQQDAKNLNLTQQPSTETFLEAKRREYKQRDAKNPNSTQQPSTGTFLKTKRQEGVQPDSTISSVKNIEFGSQIAGELSQSISWVDGNQPQLRGIINLSEDLLASDGSVALPANSSIIATVEADRNGLIDLQAIAISYENESGQLVQQPIQRETFLIQDENNSPLIVENNSSSGGEIPGQDAVFDLIGSQSRTARRVVREVENLNERNNSRLNTYELKQGTKLTITVNSFLEISR